MPWRGTPSPARWPASADAAAADAGAPGPLRPRSAAHRPANASGAFTEGGGAVDILTTPSAKVGFQEPGVESEQQKLSQLSQTAHLHTRKSFYLGSELEKD